MSLREKIANALEEAFAIKRRNQVFRLRVSYPQLRETWRDSKIGQVFVLTQDSEMPIGHPEWANFNPCAFQGAWIYKSHYKANKEAYLNEIMKWIS